MPVVDLATLLVVAHQVGLTPFVYFNSPLVYLERGNPKERIRSLSDPSMFYYAYE